MSLVPKLEILFQRLLYISTAAGLLTSCSSTFNHEKLIYTPLVIRNKPFEWVYYSQSYSDSLTDFDMGVKSIVFTGPAHISSYRISTDRDVGVVLPGTAYNIEWFNGMMYTIYETTKGVFLCTGSNYESSVCILNRNINLGERWEMHLSGFAEISNIESELINNTEYTIVTVTWGRTIYKWAIGLGLVYYKTIIHDEYSRYGYVCEYVLYKTIWK